MSKVTLDCLAGQIARLIAAVGALQAGTGSLAGEIRGLRGDHQALDQRVREMTADGRLSLAFIARQGARLLDERGHLRDDVTVVSAMVRRLEGTVQGLSVEVRGEHGRHDRPPGPAHAASR